MKGEKGRTRNFKQQVQNEKGLFISHTLFKNKQKTREQKKKEKWQKEKKQKMSSPNNWVKNNIFSDTSQQASKKCKNWRPFFKRQKNKTKQEK